MSDIKQNETTQDEQGKKSRIKFTQVLGGSLMPVRSAKAAYNAGRNLTGPNGERQKEFVDQNRKYARKTLSDAKKALFKPPQWESIEEMESGWGVDDSNRKQFIKNMNIVRWAYVVAFVLACVFVVNVSIGSITQIIVAACAFMSTLFFGLNSAILSWRLHCLIKRVCPNFIQYLKGY